MKDSVSPYFGAYSKQSEVIQGFKHGSYDYTCILVSELSR